MSSLSNTGDYREYYNYHCFSYTGVYSTVEPSPIKIYAASCGSFIEIDIEKDEVLDRLFQWDELQKLVDKED